MNMNVFRLWCTSIAQTAHVLLF